MKKTAYEIRNEYHDLEGPFTREELLARIKKGNFSGEEDVRVPPIGEWQKLASHPDFYDAFLRRLFEERYKEEEASASAASAAKEKTTPKPPSTVVRGNATRAQATQQLEGSALFERQGTQNLGAANKEDFGATIHPSDIDRLFEESRSARQREKTEQVLIHGEEFLPPIEKPLEDLGASPETPAPNLASPPERRHSDRKRLVFWGSILTVLLSLLFQMGGEEKGPIKKTETAKTVFQVRRENLTAETRKALLDALDEEIQFFLWNDGPLFYEGAAEVAREALSYEPESPRFLGLYAVAMARQLTSVRGNHGFKEEIEKAIKQGRKGDPHSSAFYLAEGLLALYENRLPDARKRSMAAIDADPENPFNQIFAADLAFAMGDYESTKNHAEEAIQLSPSNVRPHFLLALVGLQKNDLKTAWAEGMEALRWNRLYANGFYVLGEVQSQKNQLKEAKVAYEQATKFGRFGDPHILAKAHLRLASLAEISDKTEAAEQHYLLAYFHWKGASDELKGKLAGKDTSEDSLAKLFTAWEFERNFYREQGDELVRQKSYPESMRFLQAARLISPNDAMAMIKVGEVAERGVSSSAEVQKVMLIYERAIARDPQNPKGYIKLGLLETEQYNFERALQLLDHAVNLAPESSEGYLALGKHFFKRQDYARARELFIKAQTLDSTDSESEYYSALLTRLYNKEEIREPMRRFYRAYTLDPQNYAAMAEWLKLKVTNYEKTFAIKFLKNLTETDPKNADLFWVFGEVYAANAEPRRAISYYHKALDVDPTSSKVRMSLAKALANIGDYEASVDEFRKATELDQRNVEGHFEAAKILFDLKKYQMAEAELKIIQERTPNYPGVHRYLSRVYQVAKIRDVSATELKEKAIEEMGLEVQNNPENTKFILEFATLFMEYEKWDQALVQLARIANLPPESKAPEFKRDRMRAYQLMSMCYRVQSKAENAEGAIRMALTLDPSEPELHRELGYVYHALQRYREAAKAFEYYLSRSPAAADSASIKEIIKKTVTEE